MKLQLIDWLIIVFSLLICYVSALCFGQHGSKNAPEFFALGRVVEPGDKFGLPTKLL